MLNSEVMHGKGGGCSIHTKLGDMWARQDSRKRRFLGFGKRRSTSNLPSASAQGAGSAAEISGGAFRRRLATVRRLFSRRNHSQPVSGPSGVPPEDVNEAVSDGAEPQPASATAGKSAEDAVRRFDDIHPISHLGEGAIELVTFADTPYIDIQNVEGYIKPFVVFNEVIITLSKVHPYAQIALGVLVLAAQVFIRQGNLDKAVFDLLQTVRRVYEFLSEEDTIKNIDQMKDTLAKIARVISDSAQFIKNYSETKSFWKRTLKNVYSETQNIVDDYTMTLCDLMQQYRDRTTRDIRINMPGHNQGMP
ncbi:hypothetical protein EDD15DRAFT_1044144 [Pisolithus albus]|nr:hypothetical protein EDD15DRAFT_1044144 [Pisolithus albus]